MALNYRTSRRFSAGRRRGDGRGMTAANQFPGTGAAATTLHPGHQLQPADGVVTAFSAGETRAMEAALQAALRGPRGANPLVGAVVVDPEGNHLITGFHRGAGTAHAEADAIAQAAAAGL